MHASSMTGYSSRLRQISSSWHFCLEHDIYHLSSRMCFFLEGMFWQVWGTHFHGWHAAPYVEFWLVWSQPEGLDPNLRTRCGKHVGKEKGGGHRPRAGEASPSASVLPGFGSTEASPFRPQGNICTNKGDLHQHHGKTVAFNLKTFSNKFKQSQAKMLKACLQSTATKTSCTCGFTSAPVANSIVPHLQATRPWISLGSCPGAIVLKTSDAKSDASPITWTHCSQSAAIQVFSKSVGWKIQVTEIAETKLAAVLFVLIYFLSWERFAWFKHVPLHSGERISVVQTVYHESHCTHSWSHQFRCGTGALARHLGNFFFFKRNFIVVLRSPFAFLRSQIREEKHYDPPSVLKTTGLFPSQQTDVKFKGACHSWIAFRKPADCGLLLSRKGRGAPAVVELKFYFTSRIFWTHLWNALFQPLFQ